MIEWKKLVILSGVLWLSYSPAFGKKIDTPLVVDSSMPPEATQICGLSMKYPSKFEMATPHCLSSYKDDLGAALRFGYDIWTWSGKPDVEDISFRTSATSLDDYLASGSGRAYYIRLPNGELRPQYESGDPTGCGYPPFQHQIVQLKGSNWTGWMFLTEYEKSKNQYYLSENPCEGVTPAYLCADVVIGNAKMHAVMTARCFLKKHDDDLENGLSYDVFLEMLESIHFVEE